MGIMRLYYGPMSCGKSTLVLQTAFNMKEAGRHYLLFTMNDRSGIPQVSSRIGLSESAIAITPGSDLRTIVQNSIKGSRCTLLFDEAQFLAPKQVDDIATLVDSSLLEVDAMLFGLLTDFQSNLFPGSRRCLELADEICSLQSRALCWCGERTTHNARTESGYFVSEGQQVLVGDVNSDSVGYEPLCRKHWMRKQTRRGGLVS